MQELGVDDFDTCTPTPSALSIRLSVALAVKKNIKFSYFDIHQAFVQAPLVVKVHMKLIPGRGGLGRRLIRLSKTFSGLKQAWNESYELSTSKLADYGFEECLTHACVFRKLDPRDRSKVKLILLYHVHDFMVARSDSDTGALDTPH